MPYMVCIKVFLIGFDKKVFIIKLETFKERGCNFVAKNFRKFLFQNSGVETTLAKI